MLRWYFTPEVKKLILKKKSQSTKMELLLKLTEMPVEVQQTLQIEHNAIL